MYIPRNVLSYILSGVLVSIFLPYCSTHAQASGLSTLKGQVIDHNVGLPLIGASLELSGSGRTTISDDKGFFRFTALRPGRYILRTRNLGYVPDSLTITVTHTDTVLVIRLRATALQLSSLDVSGTREHSVGQSFQPATVLEGAALDRNLGTSIAATIASQPGVTQRYNGPAAAQPVIRGLTGDRVLVLEDGLRTGDIATTAPDHSVTIDPLTAQRVEVIRGPAGLLYGTNTLGGVVNVIREDIPHSRPERKIFILGSQFESVNRGTTAMGAVTLPLPFNLITHAAITGRRGGDTRTPIGVLPFTNLEGFDASLGASWISPNAMLGTSVREYQTFYGVPSSFNGITLPGSHTGGVYVDLRRTTFRTEAEYHPNTNTFLRSFNVLGNYVRYEQEEHERGGFVGTRFGQLSASAQGTARYEYGRHSGALGAFTQWRDFRAVGSYTGSRPATLKAHALFGFHEITLSPLHVMVGLRYDHLGLTPLDSSASALLPEIHTRTFGALTWTIGATYALTSSLTAGLNVARAFRAPAIEELYSAGPHLASYAYEIGNPSLRAEVGTGIDAFLRLTYKRATAELSFFSNGIRDFIRYAPLIDSATGLPIRDPRLRRYVVYQATQNNARLTGLEGSLQWELRDGIILDAVANTLQGMRNNDIPLPLMPPTRMRVGLRRDRPLWFIGGHVETTLSQNRVPSAPSTTGSCALSVTGGQAELLPAEFCVTRGITLLNSTAGIRRTIGGILHTVTLSADNLLNRVWRDPLWRAKQVAPQPGRNIRLLYRVTY